MKLTALGTSGSFPGPGSSASCYLVESGGESPTRIVLDLGSGALTPLQRAVDVDSITAVVLSHLHPDHCMDMMGLYVRHTYNPRFFSGDVTDTGTIRTRTPVYAPAGAQERLARAYLTDPGKSPVAEGSEGADFGKAFEFIDLDDRTVVRIGSLTVEAFLVAHPVETYALRVTDDSGSVLVYSADTDACDNLIEAARDADLFLCEAAFQEGRDTARGVHLTGRRAGEVAAAADVRALVLTHIPVWTDSTIVRGEAAGQYRGPIELAKPDATWTV